MAETPDLSDLGRNCQPIIWSTIEKWHRAESGLATWDDVRPLLPAGDDLGSLVERLQMINTFQWHEEDKSRAEGADDTVLATVKRSIDDSNRRRVRTVDALDDLIVGVLTAENLINDQAPLNSESAGSILDRLTVLALKIFHLKEAVTETRAAGATPQDPELGALLQRHQSLAEQMVELSECLDRLLAEVQLGRRRLKLYRQVKVYRDATTGRLRSDLE